MHLSKGRPVQSQLEKLPSWGLDPELLMLKFMCPAQRSRIKWWLLSILGGGRGAGEHRESLEQMGLQSGTDLGWKTLTPRCLHRWFPQLGFSLIRLCPPDNCLLQGRVQSLPSKNLPRCSQRSLVPSSISTLEVFAHSHFSVSRGGFTTCAPAQGQASR